MITLQLNLPELGRLHKKFEGLRIHQSRPDYTHLIRGLYSGNWLDNTKPIQAYGLLRPINELGREGDQMGYYLVAQNDTGKGSHCNIDWGCTRVEDNGSVFETYCAQTIFQLRNKKRELREDDRGHEMQLIWVPMCVAHHTQNSFAKSALDSL